MARRGRERTRAAPTDSHPLSGFREIELPYAPMAVLPEEQIETLHHASLRILSTIGMKVLCPEARRVLRQAGAALEDEIVRLDPAMVMEHVAQAPSEFLLEARNPQRSVRLGRRYTVFSSVGGPAFVSDLDRGRRAGSYAEMCDFIRLVQSLDILHQEGGGPFEALDLPQDRRHLDLYHAQATLTDKNWQPSGLGRERAEDALEMAAIAFGIAREALVERVVLTCVINTNSPLTLDLAMAEGLMAMAAHGQAVVVTPFTLSGAMSPVTLAGALAQQNAEALFGITLTQCVRPGAPVVYGGFTTNVDMRTGSPAFGTPEYTQAAQITGQLARRYGVPFRSSNATGSNACDAQAAYESQMSIWGALTGHAHLLNHAAGWLGGGLTASFEKLILDAEMLQMMAHYMTPPKIDAASIGLEAIAAVGHGGHFFGTPHTLERYQTAFYTPLVSDWSNFETWTEAGAQSATERANAIWKRRLADYEKPPIDPGIEEALGAYVSKRKLEITRGIGVPRA
ncbi:MAG: trimethylamine methyltransferase family protein [Pseudomonadota bacterium]